jgi:hypothetical protein
MTEPADAHDALARALDHLAAGAWQPAHEIVQKQESPLAAWLHGIVHLLEPDLDNARGWYRRAEREFPGPDAAPAEIAAARRALHDARASAGTSTEPAKGTRG